MMFLLAHPGGRSLSTELVAGKGSADGLFRAPPAALIPETGAKGLCLACYPVSICGKW